MNSLGSFIKARQGTIGIPKRFPQLSQTTFSISSPEPTWPEAFGRLQFVFLIIKASLRYEVSELLEETASINSNAVPYMGIAVCRIS
jgi:hypothetical protein